MAQEEELDFTKLSIEDKVQHKNWKARVSGFESLVDVFNKADDDKSPEFNKYAALLKKAPLDTNLNVQEKGLLAINAFLANANINLTGKIASDVINGCLTKAIMQIKPKIKELILDVILMYIELEKQELVIDELIKGFENKSPKVSVSCLVLTKEAIKAFGPKIIKIGPIIKLLPNLLEHKDKNVREETKLLSFEIYKWIKDAMKPQLSNLKPVILNDLEEEFIKLKNEKPIPTRYIRSEQQKLVEDVVQGSDENENVDTVKERVEEIDPFELLEPEEILSKLPSDFYEKVEAKKWQERKEAIETVIHLLEVVPKLANDDYSDLVKVLKKIISNDANIIVVLTAAKCLTELASKLRKGFSNFSHGCINTIIAKFKEKKQNVVIALREAVDACLISSNFETILEDIVSSLENKNPQIRLEVVQLITRYISSSHLDFLANKKNLKSLIAALTKTLNDMDGNIREHSAECLGTLMKAVGEKVMTLFINEFDSIKLSKIKEFYEKATIKYSIPSPNAASSSNKGSSNVEKKSNETKPKSANTGTAVKKAVARPKTTSTLVRKNTNLTSSNKNLPETESVRPATTLSKTKSTFSTNKFSSSKSKLAKPAIISKSEDISKNVPLLCVNNLKEHRLIEEKQLKLLKWNFTTPRDEFFTELKELMQNANWNVNLITNCFHIDFKFHLKAIISLIEFMSSPENESAVISNSDLILKWVALRFFDTNPSVILKLLELLLKIFTVFKDQEQLLSDTEAQNFIPYLILKTGDPKDVLRQKVHDILDRIKDIYSPTKLFVFIISGLTSKNARQRTACIEELGFLIKTYGMNVCQPSAIAACKEISKQIGDKDSSVRNAALNCILEVHNFEGEKVFKIIGNLNDKDLEMLEKRIKRASKNINNVTLKPLEPTILIKEQNLNLENKKENVSPPQVENKINELKSVTKRQLIKPKSFSSSSNSNSNSQNNIDTSKNKEVETTSNKDCRTRTPSPETVLYANNINSKSAIKIKSAQKSFIKSNPCMPLQLDFQDTDLEYNKIEQQESKYSTYNNKSLISKFNFAKKYEKLYEKKYESLHSTEELLAMPEIQLPKRKLALNSPRMTFENSIQDNSERVIVSLFSQLSSLDIAVATEACNQLKEILSVNETAEKYFFNRVDHLIILCSMQFNLIITTHLKDDKIDKNHIIYLFRRISRLLTLVFSNEILSKKVGLAALRDLISRFICILIDNKVSELFENDQRQINVLVIYVLTNSDQTAILSAMIRLLHDSIANNDSNQLDKISNLVLKCIWKLIFIMNNTYTNLNIDFILLELDNFLKKYPSSYWKPPESPKYIAWRTIKTIIYSLAKKKKHKIFLHMSKIPDKKNTDLYRYLTKVVDQIQNEENCEDNISASDMNFVNDLLQKIQKESKTEYFINLIEFCHHHSTFNLQNFMQDEYSEFFISFVQDKINEIELSNSNKFNNENKQNGTSKKNDFDIKSDLKKYNINNCQTSTLVKEQRLSRLPKVEVKEMKLEHVNDWFNANMKILGKVPAKGATETLDTSYNGDPDEKFKLAKARYEQLLLRQEQILAKIKK